MPSPHPGADLLEVIDVALGRESALFSAGELVVLRAIQRLPEAPLELYARLTLRVGPVFRLSGLRYDFAVAAAAAALVDADLAHGNVPDDRCLAAFDAASLKEACRRLDLPATGRRADLEARLRGRRWVDEPVIMPCHARLLTRVDLFYFQRAGLDRSALVTERLGATRWASYTPTGGAGLVEDRRALLRWERARREEWATPDEALEIALAGPRAVGLCPWSRAAAAVLAADPPAEVLRGLAAVGAPVQPRLALRLERDGKVREALAVCRAHRRGSEGNVRYAPDPAVPVALDRTGRRLARALGEGWRPGVPLERPPERVLRLRAGGEAGRGAARPTWRVGGEDFFVENAIVALLDRHGRQALHAEGWLWTSLYALCFRDLYWLPVPGMLPTPRRAGPLDVGTPGFYVRRRDEIDARLIQIRDGGAGPFTASWQGERLAGLSAGEPVAAFADRIPGPTIAAILARLARDGWRASRGLPDLWVFPGTPIALAPSIPSRVGGEALLVEIKGPTDTLRDEQRVWHDALVKAGIPVEIWRVAPTSLDVT